jgi:ABC-2 type transport system ATP-binding protein
MKLLVNKLMKKFETKEVLKGATFTFEQGKIYGLIGRNGAGKTTFFNCLNEDIKVDSGTYEIEENGITRPVTSDDMGYVLSTPVVPEFLTAREFLKFFIDINKNKIEDVKTIDEYLDFMQIGPEDRDKLLKDFSHGMKNKMQMLVNFIANPAIILLDEPLTSFDVIVADEMKQLLRKLKKDHIIIFSTHIMELALDLCDDIVILNNGILEEVAKDNLDNTQYKDKIIAALKGEEDD